jgi:hypothetical protein
LSPEAERFLEKAKQCLKSGRAELGIQLANDAARKAYLAVSMPRRQ